MGRPEGQNDAGVTLSSFSMRLFLTICVRSCRNWGNVGPGSQGHGSRTEPEICEATGVSGRNGVPLGQWMEEPAERDNRE